MYGAIERIVRRIKRRARNRSRFVNVAAQLDSVCLGAAQPTNSSSTPAPWAGTEPELLWLFDNTAFPASASGGAGWRAEFVAAAFRPSFLGDHVMAKAVAAVSSLLGLADDADERRTVAQRLGPFLWPPDPACRVEVFQAAVDAPPLSLGATNVNGIAFAVVDVPPPAPGALVPAHASCPDDMQPTDVPQMLSFYAASEGWAVISDIDDTIKITQTSCADGILRQTFALPARPVAGMPQLYAALSQTVLPAGTAWFYLSASPYNLYAFLRDFRTRFYPPGSILLRDTSLLTLSGLMACLTVGTLPYKVDRMHKIHAWLPHRRVLAIGDSTQADPEAYGQIYRTYPGWIQLILIRRVSHVDEVGLQRKNKSARFEAAFQGVPRTAWHVFDDPAECLPSVVEAVRLADADA